MSSKKFKFIDLFSGIGAFHIALESIGGECVFASEIDKHCIETYFKNFGMDSNNNICDIKEGDIPKHDVLCAGFPCQAFSNAGKKRGFNDTRGTLFFDVERILKHHKTKYIILENVKHLLGHDNGRTWSIIKENLEKLGYVLTKEPIVMSPHHIGIPQNRERVFILGVHKSVKGSNVVNVIDKHKIPATSIYDVLNKRVSDKYRLNEEEEHVLNAWDNFHKNINKKVYGFPVWVGEFGLNYDISDLPKWKQDYIVKNRKLYKENKKFIDQWMEKFDVKGFKLRDRKFEWQAGADYSSVWETSIQYRQSGIRCKKTDYFPTLVAMVQTPIVGKYRRRISPREAARLQSFPEDYILNKNDSQAYKQLGNSANVEVIKFLAKQLLSDII